MNIIRFLISVAITVLIIFASFKSTGLFVNTLIIVSFIMFIFNFISYHKKIKF
ncbi:hypothetical protein GCM10008906_04340 [Clostridium oceanicum]|uniref:Uncharacterized protein n=1 Tax=Clostridium oceanicum TaxID=1543 RepID=A0ABP3UGF0_9CLOT